MSNMSYCRFHNTLYDLLDCERHIDDEDLSKEEEQSRKELLAACVRIATVFGDFKDES